MRSAKCNRTPTSHSHRRLTNRARQMFETLESRLLLSVTWDGGGSNNWNNDANWNAGGGVRRKPTATDDVIFNYSAEVTMDGTPVAKSLAVSSGATVNTLVTLKFAAINTLTVDNNIDLQQAPNHRASLTLSAQGTGVTGTVKAASLTMNGADKTGSSGIYVNQNTTLSITGDINTNDYAFNADVQGTVTAKNAYFNGKDLTTALTLSVRGSLAAGNLRIGGTGVVNATVDGGTVQRGHPIRSQSFDVRCEEQRDRRSHRRRIRR